MTVRVTTPLDGVFPIRNWDCSSRYEPPIHVSENTVDWRELMPVNNVQVASVEVVQISSAQLNLSRQATDDDGELLIKNSFPTYLDRLA